MSASPFRSISPDEKSPRTPHLGMGMTRELPLPNTQRWSSSPASHALSLRPGSSSSSASICGSTRRSPPTAELHSGMIPAPTVYRSPPILPRIQTADPLASPVQAVQGVAVEVTGQHKRISGDFVLSSPPKRHRRDVSHSSLSAYPTPARSNDSLAGSATRYWSPPKPTHVEPYRHPQQTHLTPLLARPRLSIHPYAAPQPHPAHPDARFYSACAMRPQLQAGLFGPGLSGPEGRGGSPASAISAGAGFKAPRKRADDSQLAILLETFERTSYPSTEEREHLARKLGMTSRSVQIWFQNRRRAVKVEQQSALQRAEAQSASSSLGPSHARGMPVYEQQDPSIRRGGLPGTYSHLEQVFWGRQQQPTSLYEDQPRAVWHDVKREVSPMDRC